MPSTLVKRSLIQNTIRKVSDDYFMKLASYSPRLSYYLSLIKDLKKYTDTKDLVKAKEFKTTRKPMPDRDAAILIATFSPWIKGKRLPTNGNYEPLCNFFITKVKKLVMIDQVCPGSDFVMPFIEVYEKERKKKKYGVSFWLYILWPFLKLTNTMDTHIAFKMRDFFSVVDWCMRDKTRYDIFIGLECINAFAGIVLRKFGLIKQVIYYVSDYSPNRYNYKDKWFNRLYLLLDRFCAMHADYIWDVSKAMQPARIMVGLDPKKSAQTIHVPNGLYPEQLKNIPIRKIKPFSLVFMGSLSAENGPEIIVEALPIVLQIYPDTKLHIIGGRKNDIARVKQRALEEKVLDRIKFYGFIQNSEKMSAILRKCHIALAPYLAIPGSPRYYGDAGKIRAYTAAGLPVVTTNVPPLGKEAAKAGAAIIVKDNASSFADAIMKIFSDRDLYLTLRKSAIQFAKNNTWENTFSLAFAKMENPDG